MIRREPAFQFDTAQDAVKSVLAALDVAITGAPDEAAMLARAHATARAALEGLLQRKGRFTGLGAFENSHLRLEADNFTIDGFDVAPGKKSKPLVMSFKKPDEVIGNHIAKYQSVKLAKMIMAYDFERQMNPFVELGGFIFTFIGDGAPGTGKTTLIQMIAGLVNEHCKVAGYPFHYENFGVDQISSYQGKSGQNCRQFIDNIINPKVIAFGTIDDIDQVAAKRSDDRASAGQQEITGVLMDAFAGAQTVVRGNATFGMFSNYPENVDDALRQRASARWLVDGPQTREDYIDIFALLAGKNHQIPLGEHELYAAQEIKKAVEAAYDTHDKPQEEALGAVFKKFVDDNGPPDTMAEIGEYLFRIKEREPRFTGRAIKNVTDAIKMRAMDIELPDEWFEKPETFMHKAYDDKKAMISELRKPVHGRNGDAGGQPLRRLRVPLFRQVGRQRRAEDDPRCKIARTGDGRGGGAEEEGGLVGDTLDLRAWKRVLGRVNRWFLLVWQTSADRALDKKRKEHLKSMLEKPGPTGWRKVKTLSSVIGANRETTTRLLIELDARGSESGNDSWAYIKDKPLPTSD